MNYQHLLVQIDGRQATVQLNRPGARNALNLAMWSALPALLAGTTLTLVMFVDYSAMAGAIGAGGLGSFAIKYGYQRFNTELMLVTVAILVLIVQAIQLGGEAVVRRVARRR